MIDLTNQTYEALLRAMLSRIPETYDKRDTGPIQTALGPAAWALEGFYLTLDQVQRAAFIQTARGEDLDRLAVLGGLTRSPATPAVRLGLFDAPVPIGSRFSTTNGGGSINFTATDQAGDGSCWLTAETPGAVGNECSGALLPIAAIPGLRSAVLADILIPGREEEDDEALRARLVEALNNKPFGGNIAAYRAFISQLDGVGGVQVHPVWDGGGTVKCSVLGADFLPASETLVEQVQLAVDPPPNQGLGLGMAPIGARVTVTAPELVRVDVSARLTLSPSYGLEQVRPLAVRALEDYLLELRKAWAVPADPAFHTYVCDVYLARAIAAMVSVPGVRNASSAALNGSAGDLALREDGLLQQLPVLGEVKLFV